MGVFSSRRAGIAIDRIIVVLGVLMLAMTLFVALASQPPIGEALRQTVLPNTINFATITTIVGGTVGGYITYAGAHRILDRGMGGAENVETVSRAALRGILVTGLMRYILFLAILGVVASGVIIDVSGKTPTQRPKPSRRRRASSVCAPSADPVGRWHHQHHRRLLYFYDVPERLPTGHQ